MKVYAPCCLVATHQELTLVLGGPGRSREQAITGTNGFMVPDLYYIYQINLKRGFGHLWTKPNPGYISGEYIPFYLFIARDMIRIVISGVRHALFNRSHHFSNNTIPKKLSCYSLFEPDCMLMIFKHAQNRMKITTSKSMLYIKFFATINVTKCLHI